MTAEAQITTPKPDNRSRFSTLFSDYFVNVLGQVRILKKVYPGIMHFTIFWGMIALFIGTILATIDWDVTHLFFNVQFLTGWVYVLYELILDIFGVLLLVGIGMAIYRRYISKPDRLAKMPNEGLKRDDAYILIMLVLI